MWTTDIGSCCEQLGCHYDECCSTRGSILSLTIHGHPRINMIQAGPLLERRLTSVDGVSSHLAILGTLRRGA